MNAPNLPARRVIAATAAAGLTLLAAACGSSGSSAAGPTVTVTRTATASAPATAAASPAPTSSGAASPAASQASSACPTSALSVKLGVSQGAAGSVYQVIDFTNIGSSTCTLYGFPGVSFTTGTSSSQVAGLPAAEDHTTARQLITLAPGATGNALLRIVNAENYPASRCTPVSTTYIQVYPPNQTTAAYIAYKSQTCTKKIRILTVSAVRSGAGSGSG
ncbi:MAG: DUF4232 domain-containing protein [Streptosporangiaceae bacterium]